MTYKCIDKMMKNKTVTIIRQAKGVGIDKYLNGYDMNYLKLLKRKVYNGRLCFILNGKPIGYSTIKKNKCNIAITDTCPF